MKGHVVVLFLIFAVIFFVGFYTFRDNIYTRSLDPFIGQKQAEMIQASQQIDSEIQFFSAEMRKQLWAQLRTAHPVSGCETYYGRPLGEDCPLVSISDLSWRQKPVKAVVMPNDGIQAYLSSGQFKLVNETFEVKDTGKNYMYATGGFVETTATLNIPSLEILKEVTPKKGECALNVPPSVCPGKKENEFWIAEGVVPFGGLSSADKYFFHIIEQIKSCMESSKPCWCEIEYPTAKVLGIDDDIFTAEIVKPENEIVFKSTDKIEIRTKKEISTLNLPEMYLWYADKPRKVEELVLKPLNKPEFFFSGATQFTSKSAVVLYSDKLLFPDALASKSSFMQIINNQECSKNQQYVIKLTSKKLYPPDATPLSLFVAVKS